jgi:hypothetical protein
MYGQALALDRVLGRRVGAAETAAGLAVAMLADGDRLRARAGVATILEDLADPALAGVEEPARLYLACHRVLWAADDPRARELLTAGHRLLQERAGHLADESRRQVFFEQVPTHHALLEAWRRQERSEGQEIPEVAVATTALIPDPVAPALASGDEHAS